VTTREDTSAPAVGTVDARGARLMRLATFASVTVAVVLIVAKISASMVTGSVSLLSSLVDSLLDAFASLVNLIAVRHALQPADREHRFGHGKAEPLAGLAQAAFIAGSSVFIAIEAVHRLASGEPVENTGVGIAVMVLSIVLTLTLVTFQARVVKLTGSTAIGADALHYRTDLMLNLSVIAALVAAGEFGLWWFDGVVALAISAYIGWSSWRVALRSYDLLMDKEFPDDARDKIKSMVWSHPEVRGLHDLRTRSSGIQPFIQLHLVLDPDLSLLRAHQISDEVELLIMNEFPGAEVIIHQDPLGHEEPHGPLVQRAS